MINNQYIIISIKLQILQNLIN